MLPLDGESQHSGMKVSGSAKLVAERTVEYMDIKIDVCRLSSHVSIGINADGEGKDTYTFRHILTLYHRISLRDKTR